MGASTSKQPTSSDASSSSVASSTNGFKSPSTLLINHSTRPISGMNDVHTRSSIPSKPQELFSKLTKEEQTFINQCFQGLVSHHRTAYTDEHDQLDADRLIDVHSHMVGVGTNESGCYINYKMDAPISHPLSWIKKKVRHTKRHIRAHITNFFLSACGVSGNESDADLKVAEISADLRRHCTNKLGGGHGKSHIFAFDQYYDETGVSDKNQTGFYVPNSWVFKLAAVFPDVFIPVASIHPYRPDAIEELQKCYNAGARMVKWLPNSQGINPSHPKCAPFYVKMKELNMILLTHTGVEHSVDMAYHNDELGNPLLLRVPLDAGVRVIAAHCASEGAACLCHHQVEELEEEQIKEEERHLLEDDDEEEEEEEEEGEEDEKTIDSSDEEMDEEEEEDEEEAAGPPSKRQKQSSSSATPKFVANSTAPHSAFSLLFGSQPLVHLDASPQPSNPRKRKSSASTTSTSAAVSSTNDKSSCHSHTHGLTHSSVNSTVKVENFDLFIKLMDCKKYEGLLFGDLSSITAHKRVGVLETLLNRQDLHHRFINGTDYPVPAVYVVVWSSQLRRKKLITRKEEKILNKIYSFNPLLFDLCLKRSEHNHTSGSLPYSLALKFASQLSSLLSLSSVVSCMRSSTGARFLDCCFHTHPIFDQVDPLTSPKPVAAITSLSSVTVSTTNGSGSNDSNDDDDDDADEDVNDADEVDSDEDEAAVDMEIDSSPSPPKKVANSISKCSSSEQSKSKVKPTQPPSTTKSPLIKKPLKKTVESVQISSSDDEEEDEDADESSEVVIPVKVKSNGAGNKVSGNNTTQSPPIKTQSKKPVLISSSDEEDQDEVDADESDVPIKPKSSGVNIIGWKCGRPVQRGNYA